MCAAGHRGRGEGNPEWLEADLLLLGVEPDVDDLAEVDREFRVLGLELVPALAARAHLLAERAVGVVRQPQRQHLAAREADVDPLGALLAHACAASTSSVRTPPVALGWRKATRLSRIPRRGSSSSSRNPAARTRSSAASMSSVP